MKPLHLFLSGIFICLFQTAHSAPVDMPANIEGAKTVDAEGTITMIQNTNKLVLVDARITKDRSHGYIEGSISLPDIDTTCESLWKIIPSKTDPALFYCNGVKCGRSVKSIRVALGCGYNDLYWFRGGYDEWITKGYPYIKE
jgi:rhodanese-related sulfurtransferase